MYGIICQSCIDIVGHSLFLNYKQALTNYLKCELIDVHNIENLQDITHLFIIDEHYSTHLSIWSNDSFINKCNENGIKIIVFNFEKIYNSQFSWNVGYQEKLQRYNKLIQFNSDVSDINKLNNRVTKQLLSKDTQLVDVAEKEDKILFIGQLIPEYYPARCTFIEEVKKKIDIEVKSTDRKLTYTDFLHEISKAKYIINPLGTGDFLNLRFYEALALKCIVLQQYTDEMEQYYPELNHPSVIKFKTVEELICKLSETHSFTPFEYTLEDYLADINLDKIIHED